MKERVAVIGSGAAGMAAAYLLQQKLDVTLFETADRLGGHAHSVSVRDQADHDLEIDIAFLIFNERTYPNFCQWLELLGAMDSAISVEMSSCFSDPLNSLHFALGGRRFWRSLAQLRNVAHVPFWKMLVDIFAFRRRAYEDLTLSRDLSRVTVGDYLKPYGREFRENFVLPLTSAIWSLDGGSILEFPVERVLNYFYNHQLLRGKSEKRWRTFKGSSGTYVRAFQKSFRGKFYLSAPVSKVVRSESGVQIYTNSTSESFDYVVFATPADISLKLLAQPNELERSLLGAWRYRDNPVVLHKDVSVLHSDPALWASWNMRRKSETDYEISYWINRVQSLSTQENFIVTLGNPAVREELVVGRYFFRHPIFSLDSVKSQKNLASLNGHSRSYFCGNYFGYGFHEDAIASAAEVAGHFGLKWPSNCH